MRILVQAGLAKVRPHLQNNQNKRAEGVPQVVECLTSKHEVLSSNPNTKKKKMWTLVPFLSASFTPSF
jgi:hypothetical protein